jgi:hypothetical protein
MIGVKPPPQHQLISNAFDGFHILRLSHQIERLGFGRSKVALNLTPSVAEKISYAAVERL